MARNSKNSFENRDRFLELGLNIAYYRRKAGLKQEQLAEKADISRSFLGEIEAPNIVKSMSLEVLFRIADALDMPASKLLEFRD